MTVYRTVPAAAEDDATGRWVGAFPAGPIVHLQGAAPLILDVLEDAPGALSVSGTCAVLRELLEDVPEDLDAVVADFLEELAGLGLLSRQEAP
ncbi:hypothetical protein [Brachybacterium muris]|uniref:Pyrroloquinoline quinone biosynthesis protein PqqD n=1 Tax=Brachybacterium muris UCD-AY4 TaxID=1249481 RepID=A0A022KSL6_9MICO|nr:hypothetical protein [Brachybacterium muris]EYT48749.1 hypothetical protein D641_0111135 [Brachybacterium muris UCD-AY4]